MNSYLYPAFALCTSDCIDLNSIPGSVFGSSELMANLHPFNETLGSRRNQLNSDLKDLSTDSGISVRPGRLTPVEYVSLLREILNMEVSWIQVLVKICINPLRNIVQ